MQQSNNAQTLFRQQKAVLPHLSMTPPILMALFQSFRVAFPEMCTNCFGLMSWSSY